MSEGASGYDWNSGALKEGREVPTKEQPTTVRVRIAVAVYPDGWYTAWGQSGQDDAAMAYQVIRHGTATDGPTLHWIEADVPLPFRPLTLKGTVIPAEEGVGGPCIDCGYDPCECEVGYGPVAAEVSDAT